MNMLVEYEIFVGITPALSEKQVKYVFENRHAMWAISGGALGMWGDNKMHSLILSVVDEETKIWETVDILKERQEYVAAFEKNDELG